MVEAVSVAREATNGESSGDSVSTQEYTKLHLRASIFQKIFWGAMPPDPPTERRICAKPLRGTPTKRTTLKDFLDPPLLCCPQTVET